MSSHWLDGIDGQEARTLIESDEPIIRVVAGPGAGKTLCLKRRVSRLIESDGADAASIFVGTFTRAIANELRNELGTQIRVSTLHSLAYELLRANPAARGGMRLRFLLEYEEDSMLYDIAGAVPHLTDIWARRRALRRLQSARAERSSLPDAKFAGAVHQWLMRYGGMLIGEVVHLAVQGLESEDIPPGQFDHVVVDEYQDLTASEQELVERVWSRKGSLVVLGDNDQSIYSFRFNHPAGVNEFETRWKESGLRDIGIGENRRCGDDIVDLANLMMAQSGSSKPPMVPMSGRSGELTLLQWPDLDDEIAGLAAFMRARSDESFLVLVPRRFIGHRLAEAIGADARTAFRQEVLEHQAAQERFAAASILANLEDPVALRAWLGFHGSHPVQADRRNATAVSSLSDEWHGLELARRIVGGDVPLTGAGSESVRQRAQQLVDWLDGDWPSDIHDQVSLLFDPAHAVNVEEEGEKQRWLSRDLAALRDAAVALAAEDGATLAKVIGALRYRIATRAPLAPEEEEPRVRIMTLHAAKGLEADNIVLACVSDQMIPGLTDDPEEQAEQARLLYVAVTRAKSKLIVSWSRALRVADSRHNRVREDQVITVDGERVALMSRSRLLPQALAGVAAGEAWLGQEGI